MPVMEQVRQIYENRPYPTTKKAIVHGRWWNLPPVEWINAVSQSSRPFPTKILVAGCGTGAEAFALRRRFPRSEIVAIDFSPRSVAIAQNLQKSARQALGIHFEIGDLTDRRLAKNIGHDFDFISCHGVLSYLPEPECAMRNLARCLTHDGALYLGVNGVTHFSANWRKLLPAFGFEIADFEEGAYLREVLRLCDALSGNPTSRIAKRDAAYLAGDLFGPVIHNLPLADWIRICRRAGLYFLGSDAMHRALWPVLNNDLSQLLHPRSRAEVCQLMELLTPSEFHRMVFSKSPESTPPWGRPSRLLGCHPTVTNVYSRAWPKRRKSWHALRNVELKSRSTNTLIELRIPEWQLEIMRKGDGMSSLDDILAEISPRVKTDVVSRQLYPLYQLAAINLLPVASASASRRALQ